VPIEERDVDWICGSFMLIRRRCLDEVGPFDERFFIYDEDIDWCRRARAAGWTVRFWPGASLVHLGCAAHPFMRDKTFVHFRSRLSYLRKHHAAAVAAMYYVAVGAMLCGATLRQSLRWATGRGSAAALRERFSRQMQFLRLRSGARGG
jgi:GT2 family glycosyltransferase